jgi:hypothetical protein
VAAIAACVGRQGEEGGIVLKTGNERAERVGRSFLHISL